MASQIHSEAGSSQLPEREPLLGSDDDNSDVAKKTYASVDIRAVTLVDDEDPPTDSECISVAGLVASLIISMQKRIVLCISVS